MPISELSVGTEEQILEEAVQSPAVAMMRLSLEIDRTLRLILAVTGRLNSYTGRSPTEALDLIAGGNETSSIPPELRETLKNFWDIRNVIVHGGRNQPMLAIRALDYGLRILRMLQTIPLPRHVVRANVQLFTDRGCTLPRRDVNGVIIESFGPKGQSHGRHVFPSRKIYVPGQNLSWEWDSTGNGWGETWYRDPESGEATSAWGESAEFVGRPLETI